MSLWQKIKNLMPISPRENAELNQQKLLDWLGIDSSKPKAISEATYYTCLRVLSEAIGKMPLKYYHELPKGGRESADPDDAASMLMTRPNPFMTPATFWSSVEANCEHYGNAYVWIQQKFVPDGRFGGKYVTLGYWIMRSDCVTVYMDDKGIFGDVGELYYQYCDPNGGQTYIFRSDEVMHFKTWLTWDGIMGKSVRDILATTIAGEGYSQKYLEKLYESGMTASAVLQYTGDLDESRRTKLQDIYNNILTGARNAGKVVAMPLGMSLQPLAYKLADAQFLELKKYSAIQIAAAFGVKPTQINDYDKASYASTEAQQLAFLTDTLLYRISMYEQEINSKVLSPGQQKFGYFFKFNEKVLLRTTAKEQMETLRTATQGSLYTVNEARQYLDKPPMDGGDQLIANGNMVPLTMVGAAYGNSQEGGNNG